ncbi:MAG: GNAT family N-acetyltransferase [Candidatus Eremiobacteraeota bacterium]|nr:GNAT family N-acetyltransferase [Candidatus Eremiobacteraeota bacterium]
MVIRAITAKDGVLYRELLLSLDDRDRYLRFFHSVPHIGESEVAPFVHDRPDMIGLIAIDDGKAVGAAHAFINLDDSSAEFAVEVRPDYRHHGIGGKLLAKVTEELRARGVQELVAHSLYDNTEFALIAAEARMQPKSESAGINLWSLHLGSQAPCGDGREVLPP